MTSENPHWARICEGDLFALLLKQATAYYWKRKAPDHRNLAQDACQEFVLSKRAIIPDHYDPSRLDFRLYLAGCLRHFLKSYRPIGYSGLEFWLREHPHLELDDPPKRLGIFQFKCGTNGVNWTERNVEEAIAWLSSSEQLQALATFASRMLQLPNHPAVGKAKWTAFAGNPVGCEGSQLLRTIRTFDCGRAKFPTHLGAEFGSWIARSLPEEAIPDASVDNLPAPAAKARPLTEAELMARIDSMRTEGELSDDEANVLTWTLDGVSDEEIAKELGTSQGNVRVIRSRALKKLSARLKEEGVSV
jgi:RNA polymerase sigma factor (sigma-70 family)